MEALPAYNLLREQGVLICRIVCRHGISVEGFCKRKMLMHRLLYTWIGHEIFGTDIRVVMGSNGSKISEV